MACVAQVETRVDNTEDAGGTIVFEIGFPQEPHGLP